MPLINYNMLSTKSSENTQKSFINKLMKNVIYLQVNAFITQKLFDDAMNILAQLYTEGEEDEMFDDWTSLLKKNNIRETDLLKYYSEDIGNTL